MEDSNTVLICEDMDLRITPVVSSSSMTNKDMKYSRHWYLFPFVVNLVLLFSASWLVGIVTQNVFEDMSLSLPSWILFATIAVSAPPSLALSRVVPDASIALALGGLLTSAGLLWTWLETGSLQMISFCIITGAGISLSVQAVGITLSPYFLRDNIIASAGTLLLSACVMLVLGTLTTHVITESNRLFLYLCPCALISSLIPLMAYLYSVHQSSKVQQGMLQYEKINEVCTTHADDIVKNNCGHEICLSSDVKHDGQPVVTSEGWVLSFMSLVVWLAWGAGVDTTWLTLGWRYEYFHTSTGLTALQLTFCFVMLAIKICSDLTQPNNSLCRINLASNYMQLGLLGTSGLILCLFSGYTRAFHNHLLFTAGCALQFDDLSDLYLIKHSSFPSASVFKYKLITYHFKLSEQNDTSYSSIVTIVCSICHLLSLLLMSVLVMILGVQIANVLGYLSTLSPFSFIYSRGSFMVMSVAAISISLIRPNLWKRQEQRIMIL